MAYTDDEFQVIVDGRIGTLEVWSNTWTILDVGGTTDRQLAVTQIRGFYNDLIGNFGTSWHADQATIRALDTGVGTPADWETFAGSAGSALLPTQLCLRLSLDDLAGHRGGPFICGWTEASNDTDGVPANAAVTALVNAIDGLATGLGIEGFQLRINRPTVESTVAALQARVGHRWDVIRKRADNVPEAYDTQPLS